MLIRTQPLESTELQPDQFLPLYSAPNLHFLPNRWLAGFLLLPWLSPYTAGPTPNAWPWLVSALCAVVLWCGRHQLDTQRIAAAWLAAAALSALIGLAQYFGFAPSLSPWISQTQAGEAFANLRQRNQFATLTSIGLLALLGWLALREKSEEFQDWRLPWWAYPVASLLALGNAASSSRTGLLQWLLIAALTAWWAVPRHWQRLVFVGQALLAYGLAVLALPWLLSWVTGLQSGGLFGRLVTSTGCSSRQILWSNVLTLIAEKPWLGWGWGELDYAHFITLYKGPRFCEILDNAHNLPLHLAVELGIPAAVLILGGLGWAVWRGRPWREPNPVRQMAWGVLAVIGLHSLLEYPLWYGPFQIAVGLSVWLLVSTSRQAGAPCGGVLDASLAPKKPASLYLRLPVAVALTAVLAGVALSYHRVSQIYLPPDQRSAAYREDTLDKVRGAWLFRSQARFAELSITPLTPGNASAMHEMAKELLHYSPEPRVIEKVIDSAAMLGRDDEAAYYAARYRAAFPAEHARWVRKNAVPVMPAAHGSRKPFYL